MTAQFKPGDRVLVEAVVRDAGPLGVALDVDVVDRAVGRLMSPCASVHPLPTPAAHLRAAADVLVATGWSDAAGHIPARLRERADEIEAASAPKPEPTLREAVEHFLRRRDANVSVDGGLEDLLAIRAAIAREPQS